MSKIQDALKKIQSTQAGSRAAGTATKPVVSEQFGTLTHVALDLESAARTDDTRLVVVDRELLRANGLLAPEDQARHMADQYRLIKRPILENVQKAADLGGADSMNLIMVASALPGDGKTFNCINLALSIASERDTSVLLVDADVAKPHISNLLGIADQPGLIDLLTSDEYKVRDAIIRTDVPGLSVLPAGQVNAHATELLASKRTSRVLAELSALKASRVVIFDSPPILATAESRVIGSRMGQIMMIVRAGHTPQHAVLEALNSLDQSKAINLVLNQAAEGFGAESYGVSGYGYGYGYGHQPAASEATSNVD